MESEVKFYRHFKGGIYKYFGIAKFTENPSQEMVVYQALYGEKGLWVRPKEMFFSNIERDGYKGPRFKEITEAQAIEYLKDSENGK